MDMGDETMAAGMTERPRRMTMMEKVKALASKDDILERSVIVSKFKDMDRPGNPWRFLKTDKGMNTITGADHGIAGDFLIADPWCSVCTCEGTLYSWDRGLKHYVAGRKHIEKYITDVTKEGFSWEYTVKVKDAKGNEHDEVVRRELCWTPPMYWYDELVHYLHMYAPERKRAPHTLLGYNNGVLDVEKFERGDPDYLGPEPGPDADYILTNRFDCDWNPDIEPNVVDEIYDAVACGDPNRRAALEEMSAHIINADLQEPQFAIVLEGSGGGGKSTITDLAKWCLGRDNYCTIKLKEFNRTYGDVHKLAGKLALFDDDVTSGHLSADAISDLKSFIVGESDLHVPLKHDRDGLDFTNHASFILCTNNGISVDSADTDQSVQQRLTWIKCEANLRGGAARNIKIRHQYKTQEAKERWHFLAVNALVRLRENGWQFSTAAENASMLEQFQEDNDPVYAWVKATGMIMNGEPQRDVVERIMLSYNPTCLKWKPEDRAAFMREHFGNGPTIDPPHAAFQEWCARAGRRATWIGTFNKRLVGYIGVRYCEQFRDKRAPGSDPIRVYELVPEFWKGRENPTAADEGEMPA